jgi:hypothetical protein
MASRTMRAPELTGNPQPFEDTPLELIALEVGASRALLAMAFARMSQLSLEPEVDATWLYVDRALTAHLDRIDGACGNELGRAS